MSFIKKVVVLKEIEKEFAICGKKISGITRIEQTNGVSELFLSVIDIKPVGDGSFFLFIIDCSNTVHSFDLGLRPYAMGKIFTQPTKIDKGFCAGLCFVKDNLPITVAFGVTEDCNICLPDFKKSIAETCFNLRRKEQIERQEQTERKLLTTKPQSPPDSTYDDEAVATENFYDLDEDIKDKLLKIEGNENAYLRNEDAMSFECDQKKTQKGISPDYGNEDETDAYICTKYSKNNPYYLTVKEELNDVFSKFPPDKGLNAFFADSRWARVKYASDKYYVVGLVKENGKEKYICYGVPATYSPTPPETLKDCATFIPLSIFDLKGDGYWMMFQDAISGDCIRLKKTK